MRRPGSAAPGDGRVCHSAAMTSLDPSAWHEFFVALAGAAAALTGLLFVAVSLNLRQILAFPSLPLRVGETLSITIEW